MKKFRKFDSVEFNSYVKFINDNVINVLSHSKAKYLFRQAIMDRNFNVEDVYEYLHETILETYPEYMLMLNNCDWRKVYANYMDNEDLASQLQEVLVMNKGKKDNSFYCDNFFEIIDEMGINPEIMKIDMSMDTFGWFNVLRIIIGKAEENPCSFDFGIKIMEKSEKKLSETIEPVEKKADTLSKGKAGKPVAQYTKEDELLKIYSSVKEAVEILSAETGRTCKNSNIYQALREGITAYGFKWKYQEVSEATGEITDAEKLETPDEILHVDYPLVDSGKIMNEKIEKSGGRVAEMLVAYNLNNDKEIDKTREIGRFTSQQEACNTLGIHKCVLSNYLKGRKDSIFWRNEEGRKVRIGFERVAA